MDEALSLAALENSFIEDLNQLADWFLQYEYLLAISADLPHVPPEARSAENKVPGCQSGVWLVLRYENGKVRVRADSDALIIRGILAIIVELLDNRTPEELQSYRPRFLAETQLNRQLSTDRFQGLSRVIETIRAFAARCGEGAV